MHTSYTAIQSKLGIALLEWEKQMTTVDGKEVEKEMLKAGLAWHYLAFSKDPERQVLEDQAKAEKLNIWSEAGPVAPWDWRKRGTAKRKNWLAQSTTPASTKTMATPSILRRAHVFR